MGKNSGILYALQNRLWYSAIKCGLTTQKLQKRISNLQTSLFIDCEIICFTDLLIDCKIYEYLLKKILKEYRVRNDREFYDIEHSQIINIYQTFNYINSILDTEEKLNEYMWNNHRDYFKNPKKRLFSDLSCSSDSSGKKRLKRSTGIYVDTRY